ncbi:MAG TPA: hypothetical protein VMI33_12130 [Streptosporangiaceae bacterium]|nr:hypothetical protein [Streptosporangiaceae bacterium]
MSDFYTAGKQFQDEILSAVSKSQAAVIEAIQTWASAVKSITPDMPEVNLPFAEKLPKAEEFVTSGYDFAEQLLASQRKFAEDVLQATASALPAHEAPAKKASAAK